MAKTTEQELLEKILKALEDKPSKPTSSSAVGTTKTSTYSPEDYAKEISDIRQINEEYQNRLKNIELLTAEEEKQEAIRKEGINFLKKQQEFFTNRVKNSRLLLEQGKISQQQFNEELTTLRKINSQLNEQLAIEKKIEEQEKKIKENAQKINEEFGKLVQKLKEAGKEFTNLEQRKVTIGTFVDITKTFDSVAASTARATGAGNAYNKGIKQVQYDLSKLDVSLEDSGRAFAEASNSVFVFSNRSEKMRDTLVKNALIFEKVGGSSAQYLKNTNILNRTFGMTEQHAMKTQDALVGLAVAVGSSVADMNNTFITSMNRLSIYGKDMTSHFAKMQIYAHAAGTEFNTLIELNEKLSTFEGAGEFAGGMNALFGVDLFDVTKLAQLEGVDKTQYIIEGLQQAEVDMDDPKIMRAISKYMDPTQFRQLRGLSGSELRKALESLDKQNKISMGERAVAGRTEAGSALQTKNATALAGADIIAGGDALGVYREFNANLTNLQKALGGKGAIGISLVDALGSLVGALASNTTALYVSAGASGVNALASGANAVGNFKNLGKGSIPVTPVKNIGGLNASGLEAYKAARATGMTPAAAKAAAVQAGGAATSASGGFFSNLLGNAGKYGKAIANPAQFLRSSFASFGGALGFLKKMIKGGAIGAIIDGLFAFFDIKNMLNSDMPRDQMSRSISKRFYEFLGSAGGAALGGALLTPLPGGTFIGGTLGAMAGRFLAGQLSEMMDATQPGELIIDYFKDKPTGQAAQVKEVNDLKAEGLGAPIKPNELITPMKDGYIPFDGRPVVRTARGTFMGERDDSIALFTEPNRYGGNNRNADNNELAAAVMSLVKAMQTSNKEVVLKIDGNQIQRVSFNELTPRMSG